MSKYNLKQVKEVGTEKEFLLQAIANELAESNRLRRVAIELELIKLIDPTQLSTFQFHKNEDLA